MARKPRSDETEAFGSDSFLDIVSNIVGILIILVMVVGVRVKTASEEDVPEPAPAPEAPQFDLATAETEVSGLEQELSAGGSRLAAMDMDLDQKARRMDLVASSIRDTKTEIDRDRANATRRSQQAANIAQDIDGRKRQYEALLYELEQQADFKPKSVRIDSYQTPISRTVYGNEIHFQLKAGKIAYVPIEELAEKVKIDFQAKLQFMRSTPELTNMVGPIEGFRCRYTAARMNHGPTGDPMFDQVIAQLKQATFIPDSEDLGEPLEQALSASSRFRSIVSRQSVERTVITLWTYPDSFAEFRQLRRELYQLGFSVAGRPLPFGHPIGVSSSGSRSMAQ